MNKKIINIGNVAIGGNESIKIQSMTNTKTSDVISTVSQVHELEKVGCEIIRVAVPDMTAAMAIDKIKEQINIPLVADIHFDYKLAIEAIDRGVDKIRINPGNIGSEDRVVKILDKAKEKNIPIRVGVNSGSLEKKLLDKYGVICEEAIVESAIDKIKILEKYNFEDIVISMKSSSIPLTINSYRIINNEVIYPLHVGITEAGTAYSGTIKSAIGIGSLLFDGIGDTIRVSLTDNPIEEIKCAKEILQSLELRNFGPKIISCPTCGRTEIDLIKLANQVEALCQNYDKNIKVAVMGCVVNGPGEAKDADLGIAGGNGQGLIFKKGEIFKKVKEDEILSVLAKEIEDWNE